MKDKKMWMLLEIAIRLAVNGHTGQHDKSGKPYILHPMRVMMAMETVEEMIVGILHDVVEDTDVTFELLRTMGFPDNIVDAVDALTKREGEALEEYLMRVKANTLARKVKLKDIRDNSDILRLHVVEEKHLKMIAKYHKAYLILKD